MGPAEHGWAGPAPTASEAVLHVTLILLEPAGRPAGDALLMPMMKACGLLRHGLGIGTLSFLVLLDKPKVRRQRNVLCPISETKKPHHTGVATGGVNHRGKQ